MNPVEIYRVLKHGRPESVEGLAEFRKFAAMHVCAHISAVQGPAGVNAEAIARAAVEQADALIGALGLKIENGIESYPDHGPAPAFAEPAAAVPALTIPEPAAVPAADVPVHFNPRDRGEVIPQHRRCNPPDIEIEIGEGASVAIRGEWSAVTEAHPAPELFATEIGDDVRWAIQAQVSAGIRRGIVDVGGIPYQFGNVGELAADLSF